MTAHQGDQGDQVTLVVVGRLRDGIATAVVQYADGRAESGTVTAAQADLIGRIASGRLSTPAKLRAVHRWTYEDVRRAFVRLSPVVLGQVVAPSVADLERWESRPTQPIPALYARVLAHVFTVHPAMLGFVAWPIAEDTP